MAPSTWGKGGVLLQEQSQLVQLANNELQFGAGHLGGRLVGRPADQRHCPDRPQQAAQVQVQPIVAARKLNLGRLLCIYLSGITSASAGCAITAAYGNRGGSRRRRSGHEIGMEGGLRRGGDVTTAG